MASWIHIRIRIQSSWIRIQGKMDVFRFSWIRIRGAWIRIRIRDAWIGTSLVHMFERWFGYKTKIRQNVPGVCF